ncbi:MAG: radical SAM protein [Geoalkalibacter sp.]|jgi:radical SAM superfamily enzyme YgiQ (UPF0313 family)|uniref:B12-binding domain-containing radical SAM protein n=1 Tax=Geoalkalibacter sp. TaxID=3041440 RepID=UPI002A949B71|nr:radical SAM protein [Thermodesulfobacteriota bacterium]
MHIVLATLHVRPSAQAIPLAAGCLAAALPPEMRSHTQLVDLYQSQSLEEMAARIMKHAPTLVGFPLYVWNHPAIIELAGELKKRQPQLPVICGGPEAGAAAEKLLASGVFDAVVRGEAEAIFPELVERIHQGKPLDLAGVCTPGQPEPAQQAVIPPSLQNVASPWLTGVLTPREGGVLWEVARGCPFACDFCYDGRGNNQLRPIEEKRLADELHLFVANGVSQIWVLDSTFNHPPERGKRLLRLLKENAPHIHFHLEAKADFLDRETAQLLAGLSCSVQIGLQTITPAALKRIHRTLDQELFRRKISLLAVEGITYGFDIIYGLPGDDYEGFRSTLRFALELRPNQVDIFPLAVLPGTALHRDHADLGLEFQPQPPYEITSAPGFEGGKLSRARLLAAATDIFYNRGRAVGFFLALAEALDLDPCALLDRFLLWLEQERNLSRQQIEKVENWQPREIRDLQMDFTAWILKEKGGGHLLPAARDLIRYHYHYAETVLGPETLPAESEQLRPLDLWTTRWRLNPASRVVRFRFEIIDLLQVDEMDLRQFVNLFRPVGSTALFVRRGGEVFCESLEEDFARLLQGSDGSRSPQEIFDGSVNRQEGEEFIEFAVSEGILLPPE